MLIETILLTPLLIPVFFWADKNFLPTQYVFEPAKLQQISQNAIAMYGDGGNQTEALLRQITSDLRKEYGDLINGDWGKDDWFFNNAGGAMVWNYLLLVCFICWESVCCLWMGLCFLSLPRYSCPFCSKEHPTRSYDRQ